MKRSRKVANVSEDNMGESSREPQDRRSAAPSPSFIFIDAVTNMRTEDLTQENVRKFTQDKYNMDITKHIGDLKTMTRSGVQKESKELPPSIALKTAKVAMEEENICHSRDESDAVQPKEKYQKIEFSTIKDPKNTPVAQKSQATYSDEVIEMAAVAAKKTEEELKRKFKTPVKKKPKEMKESSKMIEKKEPAKCKEETTKDLTKKEPPKLKKTLKPTAKKEPSKLKKTPKPTVKKEPSKLEKTPKPTAKKEPSKLEKKPKPTAKKEPSKLEKKPKPTAKKEPSKIKKATKAVAKKKIKK